MCTSEAQHISNVSCKLTKRKIDFSMLPSSPTSPILNTRRNRCNISTTEDSSPVLNSRRKEQLSSPVLHTNKLTSSPIISNKKIIELRRRSNCARRLQYETKTEDLTENKTEDLLFNIESVDDFDSCNKKFRLNFKSEHVKQPTKLEKNVSIFNENYKKRKRKKHHKKIRTYDIDNIEIETVCSQEIANQIENSIIEKLESPRNILKNVSLNKSKTWDVKLIEDDIELVSSQKIEIVNSQEIRKPSELYATKFQPLEEGIIEDTSQNSYTQKSSIIETDLSQNKSDPKIEVEESQSSLTSSNISNYTVVQDSIESDEYIWSPIKKKKYKPGTYSYKFQRILRKQKANISIWKHELYLANSTNYEIPVSEEDLLNTTIVEISKINIDYGMSIFECIELNNKEKCLIIADLLNVKEKDLIKIFPPYLVQYMKIDECDIKTFINVHKVLKCT